MKKYILVFLFFNILTTIFSMNNPSKELIKGISIQLFSLLITNAYATIFLDDSIIIEPINQVFSIAIPYIITGSFLSYRNIKQREINREKKIIEEEIQNIENIQNFNNKIKYINSHHFLLASSLSKDKSVNPLHNLFYCYILEANNDKIKIVVVPNANEQQNKEKITSQYNNHNALLQLIQENRPQINIIIQRDESFFNFIKRRTNEEISIFFQVNDNGIKKIERSISVPWKK